MPPIPPDPNPAEAAPDGASLGQAWPIAGQPAQAPAEVAVVISTVLRPSLLRAVRSVFDQEHDGTVLLAIGCDRLDGGLELEALRRLLDQRPARMGALLLTPGYSTARRNGGIHAGRGGGAMRTILSFLANAPRVAFLDDDSWYLPQHLGDLLRAVDGFDWAFSMRWFAAEDGRLLCRDQWESLGPGRGMYARISGGLIDTNCYIVDKRQAILPLSAWTMVTKEDGSGQDRQMLQMLTRMHSVGWTGRHSVAYALRPGSRLWRLAHAPQFHDRLAAAGRRGLSYDETFRRWPDLTQAMLAYAAEKAATGQSHDRPA
ncbi:hypothetical protein STHU_45880 [Allostella humosa]|nr:glycosyltransferase family 2 protein [Stella humosa]BBK33954.1 hypothetical protein STHU_45880 [Stella humosa]